MNNSRSNVYRGDFRKSVKACEFTHVGVFMRTRRADSRLAAYRIVPICWQEMPVHPTLSAMRDLGSLQRKISRNCCVFRIVKSPFKFIWQRRV